MTKPDDTNTAMNGNAAVLVVGAGPVGLTVAALLARHGIGATVIEKRGGPTPLSRAIGIHAVSLELMQTLDLSDSLVRRGRVHRSASVNLADREVLRVDFERIGSSFPMVLALPQRSTEELILESLESAGGTVRWGTELVGLRRRGSKEYQVQLTNQGRRETHEFDWILACDGGRSDVRRLLGIPVAGGEYKRSFVLGDVRMSTPPDYRDQLQFFLSRRGYLLIVPLPDGMHRVICQADDKQAAERRDDLTLAELQANVDRKGPGNIRLSDPQWLACAPFYYKMANCPIHGNTVLLGDAFHQFSPLGGQGLNTGFQDAFNLAWKLAWLIKGWADRELLQSYAMERCEAARRVQAVTARTTSFITATSRRQALFRRLFLPWYARRRSVREALPRLYSGVGQRYIDTPLNSPSARGAVDCGARLPHARLVFVDDGRVEPICRVVNGLELTLFLVLHGNRAPSPRERADATTLADDCSALPIRCLCVNHAVHGFESVRLTHDVGAWIGAEPGAWLLVRPDGHLALSRPLADASGVAAYLMRWFKNRARASAPDDGGVQ